MTKGQKNTEVHPEQPLFESQYGGFSLQKEEATVMITSNETQSQPLIISMCFKETDGRSD